jgi:hypothetical protein
MFLINIRDVIESSATSTACLFSLFGAATTVRTLLALLCTADSMRSGT